jgi:hypothetical protein
MCMAIMSGRKPAFDPFTGHFKGFRWLDPASCAPGRSWRARGQTGFSIPTNNPETIRTCFETLLPLSCPKSLKRNLGGAIVAGPKIAFLKKKSFQSLNFIYFLDSPSFIGSKTFQ